MKQQNSHFGVISAVIGGLLILRPCGA